MATGNQIPDMMPVHYWPHPTHSAPLRQSQGNYGTALPHRSTPTPQCPGGDGASGMLDPTSSGMRRHSLATTAPPPARTTKSIENTPGGVDEPSGGPHNGEEDTHALGAGSPTATAAASTSQKPIRRRMRMITSCLECRRRKLKCEKKHPCHNCRRFQRECVYLGPNLDEASQQRLTEIKEKVGSLERQLERDVAKGATARRGGSGSPGDATDPYNQRFVADDVEDDLGEDRELQITPMVALDLTYEDYSDGNGTDDLIDLGIRVGKMRITERIGGLNRPRISEEIQAGIADTQNHIYGAQSGFVPGGGLQDASDLPDFLKPGDSYLAPTSGFFFGQFAESPTLLSLLPPIELGHRLMRRYLDAVHPIARCVHLTSFEGMYTSFWEEVRQGIEPRTSVQAVVFAAWFSAAVSVDDSFCRDHDCSKAQLVLHMKIGTETALSKANFLSTTRFETLQAFVMYLLPLCRDEVSRAHSVLVGAAVRVAECMGLHRDGSAYGLTTLETQVRRLVWHQLCFLDVRTCEAQGPKPAIRREDYDTKMPFNCEENELTPQATVRPVPAETWTSMLLPIMRFEINEMMRNIWTDRRKLEIRKTTLTAMLTRVENFRKRMLEKYSRQLDDRVPIQMYARLVMELLIFRLHVMVLHPYHSNTADPLPEKLSGLLVTSGVMIIEIAIRLESNPMFRDWSWYLGAYQQYQIALLLATEVFYRPNHRVAERIWPCLDWVFQLDPNVPRDQKSLQILTEIMSKTNLYMNLRKVRAPTTINQAVPGKQAVKESPPPPSLPDQLPLQGQSQGQPYPSTSPLHHAAAGTVSILKTEHIPCASLPSSLSGPMNNTLAPNALPPASFPMGMMISPQPQPQNQRQHQYQHQHQHQHQNQQHQYQQHQQHQQHQPLGFPPAHHQHMVFTGVTNGEALWGLPPQNPGPGSPENSSDGGSVAGQSQRHGSIAGPSGQPPVINVMQELDWEALHELFPTDPQTGQLSFNSFLDNGMGPW
ncbi:uncharacterized protein B0H64DRAFT_470510 [Chaetomium fimeti]|uniref:Zn(2)-C6 fungal-type domain-containing protein n=1 Tax=Chaetomium fimeti TaxID=1854472 RepID=A0AAE0LWW1_9PEZI|nr:hypothetical protein B0H64DRAFT_470510 [Chaetomium fimeti]